MGWGTEARWEGNRLRYGKRLTAYAVVPSDTARGMWRVQSPDGDLSDIVNHARAKDAARVMLERDVHEGKKYWP